MKNEKGQLTVREAGQKGGKTTSQRHGREFYQEIGHKGGQKGGETTSEKYGPEFYHEIGTKGGQKVKQLIEEGKKAEKRNR